VLSLPVPPPKPPKPKIKKLRILFIVLGLGVLGFCSAFFGMVMAVSQDLPAIENYAQFRTAKNSVVVDSQGQYIGTLSNNENQMLLDADQISPNMKNAVVSIEDARFYEHRGIDFQGLGRALVQDVLSRSAKQGASTITQQLVKQALEAQNDRSPLQKVREMAIAYHIEQQWTKDKILTEYLNTVYFGNGAYGIEAAARTYFGYAHPSCGTDEEPCASLLTPAEAAMLAGIIQNPYGYDPKNDPDATIVRRNTVLDRMLDQGYITQEQYDESVKEAIPADNDIDPPSLDSKAPYFTSWMRQQLVDRYGAGRAFFGGLKIKTSLDLEVQQATEDAINETLSGVGPTATVVIINNKDATVDAMVGGSDFASSQYNLATMGERQPGSTIKPFVLTTALSQGISPNTTFYSGPQVFERKWRIKDKKTGKWKWHKEPYEVHNYGDSYANAPIDLVSATINSDNSVYAQLGIEAIKGGPKAIARTIHKMGYSGKIETNPAMVLGTSQVTPLGWTYAFSTLANDGRRVSGTLAPDPGDSPVAYTKVTDEDGKTIKGGDNQVLSKGVIDPEVATTAKGILHEVVTQGTGKNAYIGDDSQWGKTGTTEDNTNAWFCGAITEITACVWVGYPEGYVQMTTEYGGSPVDGGTYPAIIWSRVVEAWKSIEENRAAEREAEAAANGDDSSTDSTDSTDDYGYSDSSSDYSAPTYTAPETTTPEATAPTTPTAPPEPTTPAPEATTPTTPTTPSTGGGVAPTGGASPG
jgi:penicillin-binding protein 1A